MYIYSVCTQMYYVLKTIRLQVFINFILQTFQGYLKCRKKSQNNNKKLDVDIQLILYSKFQYHVKIKIRELK